MSKSYRICKLQDGKPIPGPWVRQPDCDCLLRIDILQRQKNNKTAAKVTIEKVTRAHYRDCLGIEDAE
jgi:hypothetical protein